MSEDLIRRSDAIEHLKKWFHSKGWMVSDEDCKSILWDIPSVEIPQKVVAQITFDEEKLREIVKKAVERFKEEYEIADKPTVIRVNSIMKKEDYESLADSIRQQAPTAIVIPHNAELVTTAGRPQGEWVAVSEYGRWMRKCNSCGWKQFIDSPKMIGWHYNFCPNCGAYMRGKDDE